MVISISRTQDSSHDLGQIWLSNQSLKIVISVPHIWKHSKFRKLIQQIKFIRNHLAFLRTPVLSESLVTDYYSREKKFVVASHSDVASFLNYRSSAIFFASLQRNKVKSKKNIAKLDVGRLMINGSTFHTRLHIWLSFVATPWPNFSQRPVSSVRQQFFRLLNLDAFRLIHDILYCHCMETIDNRWYVQQ